MSGESNCISFCSILQSSSCQEDNTQYTEWGNSPLKVHILSDYGESKLGRDCTCETKKRTSRWPTYILLSLNLDPVYKQTMPAGVPLQANTNSEVWFGWAEDLGTQCYMNVLTKTVNATIPSEISPLRFPQKYSLNTVSSECQHQGPWDHNPIWFSRTPIGSTLPKPYYKSRQWSVLLPGANSWHLKPSREKIWSRSCLSSTRLYLRL